MAIALAEPSPPASPDTSQSAAEVTPSPDPSDSDQSPATAPKLVVLVDAPDTAHAGDSLKVSVQVFALEADAADTSLSMSTSSGAAVAPKTIDLGPLNMMDAANDVQTRPATVTISKSKTSGSVTLTATASAPGATGDPTQKTIKVTKRSSSSSGSSGSGSSGGSGGSGSSGGSTGGVGSGGVGSAGVPGAGSVPSLPDPGFVPPSPAGSLQNPQVALPQIAPQTPGTQPTVAAAAPNTLRGGAPGSQELTFERLASTQAAWLAALLVAFSLLLTQLRLVRPYHVRLTGDHRRSRHGLFQR